jgi:alpha-amylase/alpha-mannosidase (GH57 family)
MKALIVHGHFYQPPRENPWTGEVEPEPGAAPFHDWNERIHFECYRANAFVRAGDPGPNERFINNYAHISFNFGPTLLSWLEQHHAYSYARIREADQESLRTHNGHGNAIAQAYGHAILPLCNERDLRTQIRWGVADFRYRFGREPEALWLPETACNDQVMTALIDEGLRYVILAPHQAARVRVPASDGADSPLSEWHKVDENTVNPAVAYRYVSGDDRKGSIAVFFYDGATSRAIAFEKQLASSRELIDGFTRASSGVDMINVATDGETYGHHFKFGDLCLAHALTAEAPSRGFEITNYGEFLDHNPPCFDIELNNGPRGEGTSWSCMHGLDRWTRDCGCHTGGEPTWTQSWRTPLRAALNSLRDENIPYFESTRNDLFMSPWVARDESISLILDKRASREEFLIGQAGRQLSPEAQARALTYLELQRMLLLMYTSCGWFFNDISGIETIQILKYAARAIDLMDQLGLPSVRDQFLEMLAEAQSNRAGMGSGADIYRCLVEPVNPKKERAVNGLTVASSK